MYNKKPIYIASIFIIAIILAGCNNYIQFKKPNNFYYSNELIKNIENSKSYTCIVLDTNLYKEYTATKDDKSIILNFFKCLHKENFTLKPKELPKKPLYKIFFTFQKEKYVLNVFSQDYISVYPWDGNYCEDYIIAKEIPIKYSVYSLCTYIFTKQ